MTRSEPRPTLIVPLRRCVLRRHDADQRRSATSVPDVAKSRAYFTYAAKGHASLSRPGELLVTYLVNSQNFGDVVNDTSIYHPKFLRVPLAAICGK